MIVTLITLLFIGGEPVVTTTAPDGTVRMSNTSEHQANDPAQRGDPSELRGMRRVYVSPAVRLDGGGGVRHDILSTIHEQITELQVVETPAEADFTLDYSVSIACLVDGDHLTTLGSISVKSTTDRTVRILFEAGHEQVATQLPIPSECLEQLPLSPACREAFRRRDIGPILLFVREYRKANPPSAASN